MDLPPGFVDADRTATVTITNTTVRDDIALADLTFTITQVNA